MTKKSEAAALKAGTAAAMRKAGMDPAYVYAYEKLGYLVSDANAHTFSKKELRAWDTAVKEGRDK